ncbi:ferric reductase-like transmembrane domain-containing protein [Streptomyces fuscigenes]|uniref:ferric reductase-like transmembrane domain-containing protein n=1 Tax=Streptomyces fuscigenes TaxID=1528880 RepID=UPI001F3E2BC4|nr:ferric reductase-like transmembrane domain-containing protein [Streptomyces fuscigenes]MCF3961487.1 ferric reductase-like transmembrane domain-containing protein [Streptomyces fuscigenes]
MAGHTPAQQHSRRSRRSGGAARSAEPVPDAASGESHVLPLAAGAAVGGLVVLAAVLRPLTAHHTFGHVEGALVAFLDFFVGVFVLLALTATVVCGLLAAYRALLTPKLRVLAQQVHRGTAVVALVCLAVHIAVKTGEGHISPAGSLFPFAGGTDLAVGLGVAAAYLMVIAAVTGAVRGRFAGRLRPGTWRVLHASAYVSWAFGLAHGLAAGRSAKPFVFWGYGICGAFVLLVLLLRVLALLSGRDGPRRAGLRAYEPGPVAQDALDALSVARRPDRPAARRTSAAAAPGTAPRPGAGAGTGPGFGTGHEAVQDYLFDTGQMPALSRQAAAARPAGGQFAGPSATGAYPTARAGHHGTRQAGAPLAGAGHPGHGVHAAHGGSGPQVPHGTARWSGGRFTEARGTFHDTGQYAAVSRPHPDSGAFAAVQGTFFDTGQFAVVQQAGPDSGYARQAPYGAGTYGSGAHGTGTYDPQAYDARGAATYDARGAGTYDPRLAGTYDARGAGAHTTGSSTAGTDAGGSYSGAPYAGASYSGTTPYARDAYGAAPADPGRTAGPSYPAWAWVPVPGGAGAAGAHPAAGR